MLQYLWLILTGILFLVLGVIIPAFKMWYLIAGLNSLPKEELEKHDLRFIEKWFGRITFLFGLLYAASPFYFKFIPFGISSNVFGLILMGLFFIVLILFGQLSKKKIRPGTKTE